MTIRPTANDELQISEIGFGSKIGIGGALRRPSHTTWHTDRVPRRFNAQCKCEAGRESRKRGCAAPSEVPGVLTCARTPSANPQRPRQGISQRLYCATREALGSALPLPPKIHTRSSADPRLQIGEHTWGLTDPGSRIEGSWNLNLKSRNFR